MSADSLAPPLAQNPTPEKQSQRHQRTPPAVPSVYLQTKLCAAPVPALRVVPYFVVGPQADPLRDLPVLASLLGQDLLDLEGLVRLHVD